MQLVILGCGSSMGVPRADGDLEIVILGLEEIIEQDVLL